MILKKCTAPFDSESIDLRGIVANVQPLHPILLLTFAHCIVKAESSYAVTFSLNPLS